MLQKTISVGDTSRAICCACQAVVPTTDALRNVSFSYGAGTVSDLLVGVCYHCDTAVRVPAHIKATRDALG